MSDATTQTRTCPQCHQAFTPKRARIWAVQQYCSLDCSKLAKNRQRHRSITSSKQGG